jgi:two-component system, OmpR family, phosphate regulon response regulator PhoB
VAQKILVVEDESAIGEIIAISLRQAGYLPVMATDSTEALKSLRDDRPIMMILDWMLPSMSGIDLLRRLRADSMTRTLPVLMLTARADECDRLLGFNSGADDYVTKPFSPRELVARVKALLRRADVDNEVVILKCQGLQLDPSSFRVTSGRTELKLGPIEFRLLSFFLRHPDRVFSREQILDKVWNNAEDLEVRTVDVQVRRLRLVLQQTGHHVFVETIRGAGYRWNASAAAVFE